MGSFLMEKVPGRKRPFGSHISAKAAEMQARGPTGMC